MLNSWSWSQLHTCSSQISSLATWCWRMAMGAPTAPKTLQQETLVCFIYHAACRGSTATGAEECKSPHNTCTHWSCEMAGVDPEGCRGLAGHIVGSGTTPSSPSAVMGGMCHSCTESEVGKGRCHKILSLQGHCMGRGFAMLQHWVWSCHPSWAAVGSAGSSMASLLPFIDVNITARVVHLWLTQSQKSHEEREVY